MVKMGLNDLFIKYKEPFLVNRIVSMDENRTDQCTEISKYAFKIDNDICQALMLFKLKGRLQFREFLKKNANKKTIELFEKIKDYYKWSEKDLEEQQIFLNNNDVKEEYKESSRSASQARSNAQQMAGKGGKMYREV